MPSDDYKICPICGAELPVKAVVCKECGADEKTGWSENTVYDGLDLPEPCDPIGQETKNPGAARTWKGFLFKMATAGAVVALLWMILRGG